VGKEFGVDIKLFCFKIGFTKKFFLLKILEIMFFVLFGLGNIMKRYDESLEDVFEVIYFVVVSMSTVGYGDIVMDNSFSKVICVFCLLLGYIATSLVMYKILNSTGLNLKEEGVYNLNEKIKHFEDKR
jgi:voltage-gated potassium channel